MAIKVTTAVGGVVLYDHKVLLVHRASGGREGDWQIPGGLVDANESLFTAVCREIMEETSTRVKVDGLLAILNRVLEDENNTYFIFKLNAEDSQIKIDGFEIDDARYFTLQEIQDISQLQSLSQLMVTSALQEKSAVLPIYNHPRIPLDDAVFCAGNDVADEFEKLSHLLWYEPNIPKVK